MRQGHGNRHLQLHRSRLSGIWMAVLAVLFHALMPLAPVLAGPADAATFPAACHAELPSGSGAIGQDRSDGQAATPFQDCALCVAHCAAAGGLASAAPILPAPQTVRTTDLQAADTAGLRRSAALTSGTPRGPPTA